MPQKIIDTHVHIWDLDKVSYPWLNGDTSILNRTYSIDELVQPRLDAGISEGILVQASNNFEDTELMLATAAQTGWITAVVGWLPLMDAKATEAALNKYGANPYFKGVRHLINNEPDAAWLLQPQVLESLTLLAEKSIPYDVVGIIPAHIETALKVAEKIPSLKMVFDHLNQPPIQSKENFGAWGTLMKEAAQHPNFYAKISGLGITSGKQDWTADGIIPYLDFTIQNFGTERCFCGGDWPLCLLAGTYVSTWHNYKNAIASLVNEEGAGNIFYNNAYQFYHL